MAPIELYFTASFIPGFLNLSSAPSLVYTSSVVP